MQAIASNLNVQSQPIPKEGDPLDPGNWRPITILPLPSNLLEKAIHYQIVSFLDEQELLSRNQHGFRKGKSTSSAIMELTRKLFSNYNQNLNTSCVFIDYKKAFETLDHKILLKKLARFGFDRNSLKWVRSYLGNRRHTVRCGDIVSNETTVKYGVPLGSILGPLYFIMYVNDLLTHMSNEASVDMLMYADDTVLLTYDVDPEVAVQNMQTGLDEVLRWCRKNKLTVNPKKTKHMLVYRMANYELPQSLCSVMVDGNNLGNVKSYKYLGVSLDHPLSLEEAVNDAYLKANRKIFTLKKIRPYITSSVAGLIYKQFVLPLLDYADFLFESAPKRATDQLDKLQRRALKIIDSGKHRNYNDKALENVYLLKPLAHRRREHHLALMYRLREIPEVVLRNRNKIKFKISATKLTKVLRSPFYRGSRLWDMLDENVQLATTKVKFKRMIVQ